MQYLNMEQVIAHCEAEGYYVSHKHNGVLTLTDKGDSTLEFYYKDGKVFMQGDMYPDPLTDQWSLGDTLDSMPF